MPTTLCSSPRVLLVMFNTPQSQQWETTFVAYLCVPLCVDPSSDCEGQGASETALLHPPSLDMRDLYAQEAVNIIHHTC